MFPFLLIFLTAIIFLEGTVTTLPLTFIVLLCLTIFTKDSKIFPIAFLAGILLDFLKVRPVGATSFVLLVFLFLVFLYQRKYEIDSYPFVAASAFLGAAGFMLIFGSGNILLAGIISAGFALLGYAATRFVHNRSQQAV